MNPASPDRPPSFDLIWIRWLLDSYAFWLNRDLIDRTGTPAEQSERLWLSPFVVVSHTGADDPVFNYGNGHALTLWDMTWPELTSTPSRLTAEPKHRTDRARMLDQVAARGFLTDYRGVRVSRTGRRFLITRATVWNVRDDHGAPQGQAAAFSDWTPLD